MKKVCLCALLVLCGCDRPDYSVQLDCTYWDVDAKIYSDKVVMDVVNTAPLAQPNDIVPVKFLEQGKTIHVVADKYINAIGTTDEPKVLWVYQTDAVSENDEQGLLNGVGLVFDYDGRAKTAVIDGISFGFSYRYDCKVKIPYVLNTSYLRK